MAPLAPTQNSLSIQTTYTLMHHSDLLMSVDANSYSKSSISQNREKPLPNFILVLFILFYWYSYCMNENEILLISHSFRQITATLHLGSQNIVQKRCMHWFKCCLRRVIFHAKVWKKNDYKTNNMTTNEITLFESETHSVMPSPLVEEPHQCCFFQ